MPLHGWSAENFEKTGEVWGKFVRCDQSTLNNEDFRRARIQIDTAIFHKINTFVCFMVDGEIFDVFIRELDGFSEHQRVQDYSSGEHFEEDEASMIRNRSQPIQRRFKTNLVASKEPAAGCEIHSKNIESGKFIRQIIQKS